MAEQPAANDLAAQYDLGEEFVTSVTSSDIAPAAQPEAKPPVPSDLPRDDKGRFVPRVEEPQTPPALSPLQRLAEDFGIDHASMNEESLEAAVRASQRTLLRLQESETRRADIQRAAEPSQPTVTQPAPDQSHPLASEFDIDLSEGEKTWDPEYLAFMKKVLGKALEKPLARIKQLEGVVGALHNHTVKGIQETQTAMLDRTYAELADPDIGSEAFGDLPADDPKLDRRSSIYAKARKMAGDKADIRQVCAKIKAAHAILYPSSPPRAVQGRGASAPAPTSPTPEEWAQGGLPRPTQRRGAQEPNGQSKAVQAVADLQRELGGASAEPDSVDDFPG